MKNRSRSPARLLCGLLMSLSFLSAGAGAAVLSPVSGSTNAPLAYPGPWNAVDNLIDGVPNYDSELILGYEGMSGFTGPYTVSFDLGAVYDLDGMTLWNNAGYIGHDGEGVNAFRLRFLDADHALLGSFDGQAGDGLAPQSFGFSAASVRHVDFVVLSNHNPARGYAALYEVNFSATPAVPEADSAAMLLVGLVGVGLSVRGAHRTRVISS